MEVNEHPAGMLCMLYYIDSREEKYMLIKTVFAQQIFSSTLYGESQTVKKS